jgi:predicted DNA-binding transcriptional regulator AlpA
VTHRTSKKARANEGVPSPNGVSVQLPSEGFVRQPVVLAVFGTTQSTLWRWIVAGKFPKPYKLAPGTTVWDVEELREHMRKIRSARNGDSR